MTQEPLVWMGQPLTSHAASVTHESIRRNPPTVCQLITDMPHYQLYALVKSGEFEKILAEHAVTCNQCRWKMRDCLTMEYEKLPKDTQDRHLRCALDKAREMEL